MKASNINVSYYTTIEGLVEAIDSIENDRANYNGDWLKGGPDITLKTGAQAKLKALHKSLFSITTKG